ncbi:GNAT family N-acetyltransferase [Saccharothrix australiensis]|uniref:CubicO group peptidase (Beta-lactamase class C family) n=1 Tax=Saccharothrix australiensis TaxID=2072 RepID=A0A495VXN5_9PSEU|nr:GNAT family N-acetyltransferase [Saccharothrix australiensis]RKT54191.1 CubicO group peptidase (beta-lactamase class C family) [Saccharothrix australiensis]
MPPSPVGSTALAALLADFLAAREAPGVALGIAGPGRRPEVLCAGSARAPDRPVTRTTRFRLASLTKQVVMVAVLRLVERGELALGEPVTLRVRRGAGRRPVTVADLLCNTSGLGDVLTWRQALADAVPLPARLPATLTPRREPGERWEYSNIGFALLARVVADRVGEPFQQHVARTITGPLELRATTFGAAAADLATPLEREDGRWRPVPPSEPDLPDVLGLVSTAGDAARLAGALLEPRRLLDRPLVQHLDAATFAVHDSLPRQCPFLVRLDIAGHEVFWHDGFDGGFSAAMFLVPAAGLAFVLLANGPTWRLGEDLGPRVLTALLEDAPLEDARPTAARPAEARPTGERFVGAQPDGARPGAARRHGPRPSDPRRLCGHYRHPAGHPLEPRPPDAVVSLADDSLWLSTPLTGQRVRLLPDGPLVYALEGTGARVRRTAFVTDEAGRVTGLGIDGMVLLPRRRLPTALPWHAHRALRGIARALLEKGGSMTATRTIHPAGEDDLPAVLELWDLNVLRAAGERLGDEERAAVTEHLRAAVEDPLSTCLISGTGPDRPPDGFVTAHLLGHSTYPGYVGVVEELFVRPDRRRRGIGRALVSAALEHLRAGGADHYRIEVSPDDAEAAALFKELGWEPSLMIYSRYDDA